MMRIVTNFPYGNKDRGGCFIVQAIAAISEKGEN